MQIQAHTPVFPVSRSVFMKRAHHQCFSHYDLTLTTPAFLEQCITTDLTTIKHKTFVYLKLNFNEKRNKTKQKKPGSLKNSW